jgi:ankyrin repeat protein
MSSESLALVPTPTVPPPSPSPVPLTTLPWTLADEEALTKRENAITHLQLCIIRRDQCELDLTNFRKRYSETVINADPILHSRHILLMNARREAYYAYFRAYDALYPKTIEDILWIMAKAGHTQLVAPLMNLSKVTRNCIHLQPIMMNVKWGVNQWTQLHYCASEGLISSVKRLLSIRNIDANARSHHGSSPLHFAAQKGHVEIAQLLIEKGADVNAREEHGWTSLHVADHYNIEIARLLIQNGANVNAKSNIGATPLYSAACHDHDIARLLIENGADVNARDNDDWTPLHCAACDGQIEITRLLIENGADVNARDDRGWTPLHRAASNGHVDILHLLAEIGADLESQANSGYRALHLAVDDGHFSFIQELISRYHVDINARDIDGWTALVLAKMDDEELDDNKLKNKQAIIAFIEANGGIDDDDDDGDIDDNDAMNDEIEGAADVDINAVE